MEPVRNDGIRYCYYHFHSSHVGHNVESKRDAASTTEVCITSTSYVTGARDNTSSAPPKAKVGKQS